MARVALKILNGVYGIIVEVMLLCVALFAGYSIWDNSQVYREAKNVQDQVRALKPMVDADELPNFDEIRALNSDVVAWITVDNTNIDYPVLLGSDNLEYLNKDIYGEFSLAGSIYLDSRNKEDFSDNYSIIYGHNMDQHLMFGDLALFKDKTFFQENTDATLLLPDDVRDYSVAAVLQISAGTDEIFNTSHWTDSLLGIGDYLSENSIWYHSDLIEDINNHPEKYSVISLVTCSDGSTNDRTVLVLFHVKDVSSSDIVIDPETEPTTANDVEEGSTTTITSAIEETSSESTTTDNVQGSGPKDTGDGTNPYFWYYMIAGVILFIFLFETAERMMKKKDNE